MKKKLIFIAIAWLASLLLLFFGHDNDLAVFLAISCVGCGLWIMIELLEHNEENTNWQALANRDELTGLLNRRGLLAAKLKAPYALLILDIDHFKAINDTHGHATGDVVLKHLADHLTQYSRHGDICARWGGDEFIVILAGADIITANHFLSRLRQHLTSSVTLPHYSFSVGYTDTKETTNSSKVEQLIEVADFMLIKNKSNR